MGTVLKSADRAQLELLEPTYRGSSLSRTLLHLGPSSGHAPSALWWSKGGVRFYLKESVCTVVFHKSIPAQVRELMFYLSNNTRHIDRFSRKLTFASDFIHSFCEISVSERANLTHKWFQPAVSLTHLTSTCSLSLTYSRYQPSVSLLCTEGCPARRHLRVPLSSDLEH